MPAHHAARAWSTFCATGAEPAALWTIDVDGCLTYLNGPAPAALPAFGLAVGRPLADCLGTHPHWARVEEAHDMALRGLAGGYTIRWGAGWLRVSVTPLRDGGAVVGALGFAHPTTDEEACAACVWGAVQEEELTAVFEPAAPVTLATGETIPAGAQVIVRPGRQGQEVVVYYPVDGAAFGDVLASATASDALTLTSVQPATMAWTARAALVPLLRRRGPRLVLLHPSPVPPPPDSPPRS